MEVVILLTAICFMVAIIDEFVFKGKYEPFLPLIGFVLGSIIAKLY